MTRPASQAAIADHERDLRKCEPRPTDPPLGAIEVTLLVRDPNVSFSSAAQLIEQYAQTVAAGARLEELGRVGGRIMEAIEAPLVRKNAPYGEWCRKPDACAGRGYCPLDPTCGD